MGRSNQSAVALVQIALAWSFVLVFGFAFLQRAAASDSVDAQTTAVAPSNNCPALAPGQPSGDNPPEFTSVTPASLYEGSVVNFSLTGKGLDPTWKLLLCPASSKNEPIIALSSTASTTSDLTGLLTASPGSSGTYSLYFVGVDGKLGDTGKKIAIHSSDDTKYVPCAGPSGNAPVNINVECSFNPESYDVARDEFGKGVANHFIVVYVNIQNKNQTLDYLLQDIRGGIPAYIVSSYDKQIPEDVSTKEEQFSARAIIFRITAASASVLTGVAGFAGSTILQQAANIFAGPAQTGLQSAIPDLSTTELANLNRLGFSVTSTDIPKGSAIRVVAFLSSDILDPSGNIKHHRSRNNFASYRGGDLQNLFKTMTFEIAGTHMQQVSPSPVPTLKQFIPPPPTVLSFGMVADFTIEGSGLDVVSGVKLIGADGKSIIQGRLKALNAPSQVIDANVAILETNPNTSAALGKYEIYFILNDGTSIDTQQSVTVPNVAPTLSSAVLPKAPAPVAGGSAVLAITGNNLVQGDTQVVIGIGSNAKAFQVSTTDGKSGTANVTLPSDYSAATTVVLKSQSNPTLTSGLGTTISVQP